MTAKDQRRRQHLTGLVAGELDITSITDGSRAGRRGSSSTGQRMTIPLRSGNRPPRLVLHVSADDDPASLGQSTRSQLAHDCRGAEREASHQLFAELPEDSPIAMGVCHQEDDAVDAVIGHLQGDPAFLRLEVVEDCLRLKLACTATPRSGGFHAADDF